VGLTKQEIEEQIIHEKDLIRELVRRKRVLEIQAAQTGNNVRPEVLTEIGDLTNKIHAHEEELVRLESLPVTVKQLRVLYVEIIQNLLKTHSPGSEEERVILEAIEQLLSDDTSDFTDKSLAPG
jgi:hypothetical protein